MRVPLLELEFLLHMPDLYHELAHPLIAVRNHPSLASYQNKLGQFIFFSTQHFDEEIKNLKRNNGNEQARFSEIFRESWVEGWAVELFCDLFGVYTLGPAYAWAHLHLCVKRATNPFETPEYFASSHPADDARMQAILFGLDLIGFKNEIKPIKEYWEKYTALSGGSVDANFKMAYPQVILEHCATLALDAVKSIKCQIAHPNLASEVYVLLNTAWKKFIDDPVDYIGWEKLQRERHNV